MKQFIFYSKGIELKSYVDEETKQEKFYIKGHIDSSDLDLVDDIVTKGCMEDISSQFKSRNIKLDLDHETLKDEYNDDYSKLSLTKVPLGKAISESLDDKGNVVEFELNPNWKKFDSKGNIVMTFAEVVDNIKNGFYDAFSIAYVPIKTMYKEMVNKKARLLDKVNLINVALTGNPINPSATITQVMAKSLEYLKDNEDNKMDKKSEDQKIETPEVQEEVKVEVAPEVAEAPNEAEQKSIDSKSIAELKSIVDLQVAEIKSNKAEIKSMKDELAKINEILEKAVPKALGSEDNSKKQELKSNPIKADVLDLI